MVKRSVLPVLVFITILITACAAPASVQSFTRGDDTRTGVFADPGYTSEWTFTCGNAFYFSSPVVEDETVYIGCLDGALYAIDLKTGQQKWKFQSSTVILSTPAVADGKIYFGNSSYDPTKEFDPTTDDRFYAVDTEGKELWQVHILGGVISTAFVKDNAVYFGGLNGTFYALNRQDGKELWTFKSQSSIVSSPNYADETLYFASTDTFFYALDAKTGAKKWMTQLPSSAQSSPRLTDKEIILGTDAGTITVLDRQTGAVIANHNIGEAVISSPVVLGDVAYFGVTDGRIIAENYKTGEALWEYNAQAEIISSPAVTEDTVFIGSSDNFLYALNRTDGSLKWKYPTGGQVWSSPAVAGGTLLFGSTDKNLYAMPITGPSIARMPTPTMLPLSPTLTPLPETTTTVSTGSGGLPWWNDRVFYEVFVRSFKDSNGDGIGDLKGLISMLDYLNDGDPTTTTDLGVTGLWLMPVSESPTYHGYDVIDYRTIEKDYGTNEDFKLLVKEAHKRGMVVIVDLVMNHTSSENPWFIEAQTPGSEYENWYIWSTERPTFVSPWDSTVWHPSNGRWYYGLFWSGMPDLNYQNGAVTLEMFDIIRFWLQDMGADGFRLDAVRHLIEDGAVQENTPATHEWLQNFHKYVRTLSPDALMVGEVWDETVEVLKYIGGEVDLAFEFDLAGQILNAVWLGQNTDLAASQQGILDAFPKGQYAVFLTNHDQNRVMNSLRNDLESAKVAATLLLTNPGVPFIYYGEEVGMRGAKPDERIRTPMQWDGSATGGFTTGTPWETLSDNHETNNVAAMDADPDSLLNLYRKLIQLRTDHVALRTGDMLLVESSSPKVYAYLRYSGDDIMLVVVNLSDVEVTDYSLSLASGPLTSLASLTLLLGEGAPALPTLNTGGGFDSYTPLTSLPPKARLIIQLVP